MRIVPYCVLVLLLFISPARCEVLNINLAVMESTFAIVGKSASGNGDTVGTGFVLGRPDSKNPKVSHFVLITANHVLAGCQGDIVALLGRKLKPGTTEEWERYEHPIQIRNGNEKRWSKHPDVDLAAMYVSIPEGTLRTTVSTEAILTDEDIRRFELGPGTELFCLGYPHATTSQQGFAILRSGTIASYPILPSKVTKTFGFEFNVFPGNSGGPVYLYQTNPIYERAVHVGSIRGIMGVVTSQRMANATTPLGLAEVVHGSYISELLSFMPDPPGQPVTEGSTPDATTEKPAEIRPATEQPNEG